MVPLPRRLLAEFIGTFALVFIGCGSVLAESYGRYGLVGIALAHALVLSVMITALMSISGGNFNPAVTFGLLVARKTDGPTAAAYMVTQLVAGIIGAVGVKLVFPAGVVAASNLGAPTLAPGLAFGQAVLLEAILTFFLVLAVFGTAVSKHAPRVGGFGIGLVLLFDIIMGGGLTGAAMNPARAFGPALVAGRWTAQAVWWIGPLVGGAVAGFLWSRVLEPND
ncbi:MAG: MIP/aquaporin family protein [Gemmatimonadales bacterium]